MARPLLTQNQRGYLIEIAQGKFTSEITILFNEHFKTDFTLDQIRNYMKRECINNGMRGKYRPQDRLLTPEQISFLRDNIAGRYNSELTKMLNEKYGLNLSTSQLKAYRKNHRMHGSGLTGRFEKGHMSVNKGIKMPGHGASRTFFKPGHRPHNAVPVGTVITNNKDGYLKKKIAEPDKWQFVHVMVWEAANGPKPKGSAIIFQKRRNGMH